MIGPINGEIARLRLADLADEANRARERQATRQREECMARERRPAILRRLRNILA